MKKMILAVIAASTLAGCAMPSNNWIYPAPVEVHNDQYDAKLSINCHIGMGNQKVCQTFGVEIHNKTKQAIKIVWNDSAVTYSGTSTPLFPDGVKFIDAEKAKPDTIIPPGATVAKEATPASNVSFDSTIGWHTQLIKPNTYQLYLQLMVNGEAKAEQATLEVKQGAIAK